MERGLSRNFGKDYSIFLFVATKTSFKETNLQTTTICKYSHPFMRKLGMKEGFLSRCAHANCLTSPCHLVDNRRPLPPCCLGELWSIAGVQPKPCCEVLEFSPRLGVALELEFCLSLVYLLVAGMKWRTQPHIASASLTHRSTPKQCRTGPSLPTSHVGALQRIGEISLIFMD